MFQQSLQYERSSLVPLPSLSFCSASPRLLWPQWALELGGTGGSWRTLVGEGRRSRASHLEPMAGLHKCFV